MGVRALWQCDRDGKMFTSKKEADAYDKMLELAEVISEVIEQQVEGLSESQVENIGRLIAENKESFSNAFKGKVDELQQVGKSVNADETEDSNVTPINATN
ncbi:hypothetical protein C2869_11240 [Saccharobesus litoralis]|uniref:Uncharacterized protein n=1 Tax=Saccharobesus litoralis TaxID=2172099 RepID=A0A2S0VRY5_9ALTE|nr:YebG family protein [Saccharobesus litoralis]AWB66976.1 hypothetical protein C2869_11240 [Saccharobesus litoralis]